MAGFLYYKPGMRKNDQVTLAEVNNWGLSYAFDSAPLSRDVKATREMGGQNGFVFADKSRMGGKTIALYPDEQQWRKIPGSECQVGCYLDDRPGPGDLERKLTIRGYPLEFLDGNDWTIPLIRQFNESAKNYLKSGLPVKLDVDDEGNVCDGDVIEVYRYLWDVTQPYADKYMDIADGKQEVEIEPKHILRDAVSLVGVNYFIGLGEVLLLELFPREITDLPLLVNLLSIDYPQLARWHEQKKTENLADSVMQNTSNGSAVLPQDMPQPVLTK